MNMFSGFIVLIWQIWKLSRVIESKDIQSPCVITAKSPACMTGDFTGSPGGAGLVPVPSQGVPELCASSIASALSWADCADSSAFAAYIFAFSAHSFAWLY